MTDLPKQLTINGTEYVKASARLENLDDVKIFGLDADTIKALENYFTMKTGKIPINAQMVEMEK